MNAPVVKKPTQRSQSMNTPEVRVAYPFLHKKREKNAGGQPLKTHRFDATLLFPKLSNDPATCPNYKFISDLCMEAAGKMWPGVGWPAGGLWPIKDGDVPYVAKPKPGVIPKTPEQIAAGNAWRVGHWVVEVASFLDVGPKVVVMKNGVKEEIPAEVIHGVKQYKSGDHGIVHVCAYAYENDQWGVNLSLEGVLFTRPGEQIGTGGGPRSAAAMFECVAGMVAPTGTAPPPGAPAPPQYAPPAAPPQPPSAPPAPPSAPAAPQAYAAAPPAPPAPPAGPTFAAPPGPPMPPTYAPASPAPPPFPR